MKPLFTGCATALVTPFRDGRVDYDALDRLVEEQIANGVDGVHIYTMNDPKVAVRVHEGIKDLL